MGCDGCMAEMKECYKWQERGYISGLTWLGEHCYVFVISRNGKYIIKPCHMQD